jgi:hypothetical protein
MYLFNKRTRNIIKVIWGVLAVLIMVTMVITYSGFTMLAGTQQPTEPIEVSPEDLLQPNASSSIDVGSLSTTSPEIQELLESIRTDMETEGETTVTPPPSEPPAPAVPELNFGI